MSRDAERDDSHRNACYSTDPFSSLTKFIDECISYTLQSVIGLPSSKEDIRSWKPWEELQRKDRHTRSWGHDEQHRDHGMDHTSSQASHYLYRPSQGLEPNSRTTSQLQCPAERDIDRCGPSEALCRLEKFLTYSRYSPIALENDTELLPLRETWRMAFTDLMNETQGGPLPYLTEDINLTTRRLDRDTWKSFFLMNFGYNFHINAMRRELTPRDATSLLDPLSLAIYLQSAESMSSDIRRYQELYSRQIRRSHPEIADELGVEYQGRGLEDSDDQMDRDGDNDLYEEDNHDDAHQNQDEWSENDGMSRTELDMVEEMVEGIFGARSNKNHSSAARRAPQTASLTSDRPSIVGRMTRIERVVKPDGTVETRRVLKTRFSDGSENEESTSDVVLGQKSQYGPDDVQLNNPKEMETSSSAKPVSSSTQHKKNGWFWK